MYTHCLRGAHRIQCVYMCIYLYRHTFRHVPPLSADDMPTTTPPGQECPVLCRMDVYPDHGGTPFSPRGALLAAMPRVSS